MGVLVEVDAVEVRSRREPLVFDVFLDRVELFFDVALRALREEVDQLRVAGLVVAADVEHVVDERLALGVAEPVGGVVERLADVQQVLAVVARLGGQVDVVVHRLGLRAVREPGDRGDVFELLGERRVDEASEFDAHHARRDAVVLAVGVGVDVGVKQGVDRLRVRVVVVDDGDGDVVVREVLVGGHVLLGGAVVQHQQERELLAVAGLPLQREVEVPSHVLHLVEGGLARQALEQVPRRVGVLVDLADERLQRELNRDGGAHAVAVRVVAHADGATREHRAAEQPRDLAELLVDRLERLPLHEWLDVGRLGAFVERLLEAFAGLLAAVALQRSQRVDLDLDRVLARLDGPRDVDHLAHLDLGVRADARLLEGGTGDDPGAVRDREYRRAAGLLGLDDLALDGDLVAGGEPANAGDRRLVGDRDRAVVVEVDVVEGHVAVLLHLGQLDDQFVADRVLAVERGLVDQPRDRLGDVDEDPVVDHAVHLGEVVRARLHVGQRAVRCEVVDDVIAVRRRFVLCRIRRRLAAVGSNRGTRIVPHAGTPGGVVGHGTR